MCVRYVAMSDNRNVFPIMSTHKVVNMVGSIDYMRLDMEQGRVQCFMCFD